MAQKEQSLAKIVDGLLPESIEWLVMKQYVVRESDGVRITALGEKYFYDIATWGSRKLKKLGGESA